MNDIAKWQEKNCHTCVKRNNCDDFDELLLAFFGLEADIEIMQNEVCPECEDGK